ncbi:MAG TPA: hypothetical protein VFS39_08440, partial [Nitrospira sp.]|nr:hypothetical protein [Nitrospira sp.]
GLSDRLPDISFHALWKAMQHDKKVIGGEVIGVWPTKIGEVVIRPLNKRLCQNWYDRLSTAKRSRSRAGGGRRSRSEVST